MHAGGHGFESRWLHPEKPRVCGAFLVAELNVGHPRVGVCYSRGPERGPRGPTVPPDEAVSAAPMAGSSVNCDILSPRSVGTSIASALPALARRSSDLRGHLVRRAVESAEAIDTLYIEDLERLGQGTVRLLDDLSDSKPDLLVVATVRSGRFDRLGLGPYVEARSNAVDAVVPLLADSDIDALLDSLDHANRLGALKGKTRAQQHDVLASKSDRQLLVAMIEATSGQRFDARIDSECRELAAPSALIYAVVGLATTFRVRLTAQMLISAVGGEPADQMRLVNELERTHLVVRDSQGRLSLRHRVIAERTVEFFRRERMIETPLRGLAFAVATAARPGQLRATREGQALIRLINHDRLIEFLRSVDGSEPDVVGIRGIYQELEPLLTQDHHFWLQRGSFETEVGDLDLAKNFIEQARGLAPEDPYVRTQWAYMTLKRASRRPDDPTSTASAAEAFSELTDVIEVRGRRDTYPFHVYGSQGLAWANRSGITPDEKARLLLHIRRIVDSGLELHRTNRELQQLASDLEREYLLTAVR